MELYYSYTRTVYTQTQLNKSISSRRFAYLYIFIVLLKFILLLVIRMEIRNTIEFGT